MLTLINANFMRPLVAPIGLDYVAGAARAAGLRAEVLDLALADDPAAALQRYFEATRPHLVGLTLRNLGDSFWPSAQWFIPAVADLVRTIRGLTDAPIVVGGVGFSIAAERTIAATGADFGIRGDGERALIELTGQLNGRRHLDRVPGLLWRDGGQLVVNPPAWEDPVAPPAVRDTIDNAAYFRLGGQGAVETKRGCDRRCIYCADPLAKGRRIRRRDPAAVADEVAALDRQGVNVLHLADSEFNIPREHAQAVCEALIDRGLGDRVRWYAYMAVMPFDAALADTMRRAGCIGVNFTGDSAAEAILAAYGQPHRAGDLAAAVRHARAAGMAVMVDLLLGGPGETPVTLGETLRFMKEIGPDCVGASLGMQVCPGTAMEAMVRGLGPLESLPGLRRRYAGPVDFFQPTFYISPDLGDRPAALVRELIGGDPRFFEPADDAAAAPGGAATPGEDKGYNYSDNTPLVEAIARGERGAYWDILRRMKAGA
jgi:tryptophan 2-C-methyltransferase